MTALLVLAGIALYVGAGIGVARFSRLVLDQDIAEGADDWFWLVPVLFWPLWIVTLAFMGLGTLIVRAVLRERR